jgi:hypothetical protein
MTREELQAGYLDLVRRLYEPQAFLERYFAVFGNPEYLRRRAAICAKCGEGRILPTLAYGMMLTWKLFWALVKNRCLKSVGSVYLKNLLTHNRRLRRGVIGFTQFMNRCVTHWHFYKFTRDAIHGRLRAFNSN